MGCFHFRQQNYIQEKEEHEEEEEEEEEGQIDKFSVVFHQSCIGHDVGMWWVIVICFPFHHDTTRMGCSVSKRLCKFTLFLSMYTFAL